MMEFVIYTRLKISVITVVKFLCYTGLVLLPIFLVVP